MRKLISGSKRFLIVPFAIAFVNASIPGCAQNVILSQEKGFKKGDNCLFCHATGGGGGARDFSQIYNNPGSHHPVGMEYPLGPSSRPDFNQPNGYSGGTIFFDDDGFGELDNDDVRLFGSGNAVTVECATCHKEHDDTTASNSATPDHYLRFPNEGSKLCLICHHK